MKKRSYRSVKVKKVDAKRLAETVQEEEVVFAVDIAKTSIKGSVMVASTEEVKLTISWKQPRETMEIVELIAGLGAKSIEVAMEPSGTYGDSLRYQFLKRGIEVFRISPKRSHDAAEVYDGVPSWHDPKSAMLIGKLHLHGVSEPWPFRSERERELAAKIRMMKLYEKQERSNLNRLESLLARHWPELEEDLKLGSATMLELIKEYGSHRAVAKDVKGAYRLMRRVGRHFLDEAKIHSVLESAEISTGVPEIEAELVGAKELAAEILRCRGKARAARAEVEKKADEYPAVHQMSSVAGKVTSAVLVSKVGNPTQYDSASSYVKALGLNLKERSSGKCIGQLKITKRGPGDCRLYLYFAVLRLIKSDPVVKLWYEKKVARDGGKMKNKAVIAVMRKLVAALWHVARGKPFDSSLLFDTRKLGIPPKNDVKKKPVVAEVYELPGFIHVSDALHTTGLIQEQK